MKHTKLTYILLFTLTLLMSACHSSKNASSSYVATDGNGWHDVYMPVKVKLTSPMSMSLSGRATMVRDSLIYMSMRVFGMEVAVMNMTGDSVMFVDKYHKYLFSESLDKVMGSHKLSIGDIQNIALGLQSGSNNKLTFNNPESDKPVTVTFADFCNTPAGNIAQTISIEAPLSKNDVNADVLWSANSADWNTGRTANYIAPDKNYKRVSIDAVLKMFKKM